MSSAFFSIPSTLRSDKIITGKNDSALANFYGKILYIKALVVAVDFYAFYHRSLLDWAFCSVG